MSGSVKDRAIFLIVTFTFWFPHFIYIPMLPTYTESMGGSFVFIGLVLGSYGFMQLFFRLPLGIYSDLVNSRKPFILFGMTASLSSCVVFAMTDHLMWILVARSLAGLAAGAWVAFTVLYSGYFSSRDGHRAMGMLLFVTALAQTLGMSLSGYIVAEWGVKAPFWAGILVSLVGIALAFFLHESKGGVAREPIKVKELAGVLKDPMLLKISVLSILAHAIIFITMFGYVTTYALGIGIQPQELIFVILSFMVPHSIATLYMGRLLAYCSQRTVLIAGFLFTALLAVLTPFADTLFWLCVVQGFSGVSLGLLFPLLYSMVLQEFPYEKGATAMGVYQTVSAVGFFAGPFFAGWIIAQTSLSFGFYFAGVVGLAATALTVLWIAGKSVHKGKHMQSGL